MLDLLYTFSATTTEPPAANKNEVRLDQADPSLATRVWIVYTSADGIDAYRLLLAAGPGDQLYLQDKNDHTLADAYTLTADPVDKGSYVEYAIAPLTGVTLTTLNNNQPILAIVIRAAEATPPEPGPEPPHATLVTLVEGKDHLKLPPDPAPDDTDLQSKLDSAEAAILDYLKVTTPPTDPHTVQLCKAAILMEFGELWAGRGDDADTPRPADGYLSPRITSLLHRLRDPALA